MSVNNFNIQGLTDKQVLESRRMHGLNKIETEKENRAWQFIRDLAKEPMVILLLVAAAIYFISGNTGDGFFMVVAIILVSAISLYQDRRSRNALDKLKMYTQPNCKVIRNGEVVEIQTKELVIDDSMMVEEGTAIPADGKIVHSNDFSVNESILTGESFPVAKNSGNDDHFIFSGTTVTGGLAIATVTAIANETRMGDIGKSIDNIKDEKTPLELQITDFIKKMVISGVAAFLVVWVLNYFQSYNILDSLLKALTLAMSILPEEIPVAFTTFMALGAWRLMKIGVLVKGMKTVETLGGATIICIDKTGTITENKMSLAKLYASGVNKITTPGDGLQHEEKELVRLAMWASEPIPFDPMEISIHEAYKETTGKDERTEFKMIHEYPLSGKPPMMTHLFENSQGQRIVAAKGAPEAIIKVSRLSSSQQQEMIRIVDSLSKDGYRVLGVAEAELTGTGFPETQQLIPFTFKGFVAFYDPPKQNIKQVLESFYLAGIQVKIITGDNTATTTAIARQIAFKGYEKSLTGEELMKIPEDDLYTTVAGINLFTRMYPDAKLKIINALKKANEVVAMTGDGVNDGPALKAAHIGIAMGKRGTEIAKQAASLILVDDDLSKVVDAVAMGRRIYTNLKKAIQYIISIHIPIILTVFIPIALGWVYPNIFSPVHIIFLELIMGPTCSIIYENEPMEKNTMIRNPRPFTYTFFNRRELATSILQGLAITAGTMLVYQYAVYQGYTEAITRTMVFIVLIAANIFLTLVNRSFFYSVITAMQYKNNLVRWIIAITVSISVLLLYVKPLTAFFGFERLSILQLLISTAIGFISVIWFEIVKWVKRQDARNEGSAHKLATS
ncbi:MAG: cation-translocating P-type ATPase [Chitinophagaceae bacterium]